MKRLPLALFGMAIVIGIGSGPGCGSDTSPEMAAPGKVAEAGPNRRLRLKPEYKQAIDKDGHLILKPGMKRPPLPATPKS